MFAFQFRDWQIALRIQSAGYRSMTDPTAPIVGHVGDGNFHVLPLAMPDDIDMHHKIIEFSSRLAARSLEMGGTCTGEHGIGQGKAVIFEMKWRGSRCNERYQDNFDPSNILNPGKYFNRLRDILTQIQVRPFSGPGWQ